MTGTATAFLVSLLEIQVGGRVVPVIAVDVGVIHPSSTVYAKPMCASIEIVAAD